MLYGKTADLGIDYLRVAIHIFSLKKPIMYENLEFKKTDFKEKHGIEKSIFPAERRKAVKFGDCVAFA